MLDPNGNTWQFNELRAVYINCTLKKSPELSHTQGLIDRSRAIMDKHGVQTDLIHAVDHDIATGVWPDMTEHGWARDEWPALFERVMAAGGIPVYGNQRSEWDAGCRFDFANPEHR